MTAASVRGAADACATALRIVEEISVIRAASTPPITLKNPPASCGSSCSILSSCDWGSCEHTGTHAARAGRRQRHSRAVKGKDTRWPSSLKSGTSCTVRAGTGACAAHLDHAGHLCTGHGCLHGDGGGLR